MPSFLVAYSTKANMALKNLGMNKEATKWYYSIFYSYKPEGRRQSRYADAKYVLSAGIKPKPF